MADDRQLYIKLILQDQTKRGFDAVNKNVSGTKQNLLGLKNILLAVAGSVVVRQTLELGNTYQSLQNRIKLVTDSSAELIKVQEDLFQISQRTRGGFEETVTLYSKLALNSKNLGLQTSELAEITENVNKVIAIAGVNSIQASSGILQLSQAFASGRLQGDEFRSISENIPPLLDIFAKELGVTRGELKKLGAEGKITSEIIATALLKETKNINEQFSQLSPTIGQAGTVLQNSFLNLTGKILENSGALEALSNTIILVANAIDKLTSKPRNLEITINFFEKLARLITGISPLAKEINLIADAWNNKLNPAVINGAEGFDKFREAEDKSLESLKEYNEELAKANANLTDFSKINEQVLDGFKIIGQDEFEGQKSIFEQLAEIREKTGVGLIQKIKQQKREEISILDDAYELGLLTEAEYLKQREKLNEIYSDRIKKLKENEISDKVKLEQQAQSQIVDAVGDGLSKIAGINRKAFQAYQAFQTAMATINTFRAVSNALSTYPFPLNIGVAGAELARGLATVAQIRSTSYSGRALGGRVQAGSTYMVGEQGAEMFVPDQSGTIVANKDLGRATNVNITINANDTQGFDDLLVKRRSVIVNVINDALNSQGKEALI